MISLLNTQNITIRNCHLKNAGAHGISMQLENRATGDLVSNVSNTVYGNWIEYVGLSGISIRTFGTKDFSHGHTVNNNKVEFAGMHSSAYTAGIFVANTNSSDISHNLLRHHPGSLLVGIADTTPSYFANNTFTYNDLFSGAEDDADTGAFYTFAPVQAGQGSTASQMRIRTAQWASNAGLPDTDTVSNQTSLHTFGLYLDEPSLYWTFSNISISDYQNPQDPPQETLNACSGLGYLVHACGNGNTAKNVSWQTGVPGMTFVDSCPSNPYTSSCMDYKNIGNRPDFPSGYGNGGYVWTNDSDPSVSYTGSPDAGSGWGFYNDPRVADDFDGDEHFSKNGGDQFNAKINGTVIRWAAATFFNRGKADVLIDNVLDQTVDLYTPTVIRQNVVYQSTPQRDGQHQITINVRGDMNSPPSSDSYVVIDAVGGAATYVNDTWFTFTGCTWSYNPFVTGDYLGDEHSAGDHSCIAKYTFVGNEVSLLGSVSPSGGTADVYIDGVLDATAGFGATNPGHQTVVYHNWKLTNDSHTIMIVPHGNGTVAIDGLSYVPLVAASYASNEDPAFSYYDANGDLGYGWTLLSGAPVAGDFDDDERYTNISGAYATFTFVGSEIHLFTSTSPNRGTANIYIDGVVDQAAVSFAPTPPSTDTIRQNVVYTKTGLGPGSHTLKVVVVSGYIVIDAVEYKGHPYKSGGAACTDATQCASGFCVSGYCCDQACTNSCHACSQASTGQPNGTCSSICPGGCCSSGACVAGMANNACGTFGDTCRVCPQGSSCIDPGGGFTCVNCTQQPQLCQ
jgi:hypothetical protein